MTPEDFAQRIDPSDPWPTCRACDYGMHRYCLARSVEVWCSCARCGWIWPDGMPHEFWRPETTWWAREPAPASSATTTPTNPATD